MQVPAGISLWPAGGCWLCGPGAWGACVGTDLGHQHVGGLEFIWVRVVGEEAIECVTLGSSLV